MIALLVAAAIVVPVLSLALPADSALHMPPYMVALTGKYLCYALLALSLDLVWGYCGILSLGHGAFFALGGYAMGMYLMRQIGDARRLRQSRPARFHGVPELEGTALVLVRLRPFLVRRADGDAGARAARLRLRLAGLPLAASPASICRSSPRR